MIALRERWGRPGAWHALESKLGEPVFAEGQFAIDGSQAVAPQFRVGRVHWWMTAGCSTSGCLVVRNEVAGTKLVAREVHPARAPCAFEYLREVAGGLAGLCRDRNRNWTAWRASVGEKAWKQIDPSSVADAFLLGGGVAFDARGLTWRHAGGQFPWSGLPFNTEPSGYPIFAQRSGAGDALSFDIVNALSFDPASGHLEIGTEGGLFRWPFRQGKLISLHPGVDGMQFLFNSEKPTTEWTTGITRLRRDARERLWAQLPGKQRLARLEPGLVWIFQDGTNWPLAEFAHGGWVARLDGDGLLQGNRQWLASSDAFGVGTVSVAGVVDFDYEPGAVWIATAKHGLLKTFTTYLTLFPELAATR
jgi:hypothetical protein